MIADLRTVARALNGTVISADQVLAPAPGHSREDRSLAVKLSASRPLGFICYPHAGDDWQSCQTYVAERLGLDPTGWKCDERRGAPPSPRPKVEAPVEDDTDRIASAIALWRASTDPRNTLVQRYLASRGLELDDDVAGSVLRWHPGIGAMVALFRNVLTGRPQAISRTFLDRDGNKLSRKFLGPVAGCAVMLDRFDSVLAGLHTGEGIETCMAARQLGLRPTWALGSKGAIGAFPVLAGAEALTILAESDAEREKEACAFRWYSEGREVFINRPIGAKDLNDSIRGAA
jgi:putative DNA primase/helicase